MTKSTAQKLARLNELRALEGQAPITAWKAARHGPVLKRFEEAARERAAAKPAARVLHVPANIEQLKAASEDLGEGIKTSRAAWKQTGNPSKKDSTIALLAEGTTIKNIVDTLGVTTTAARSLIGDVRRMYAVTREGDVYSVDLPADEDEDEGEDA